MDTGKLSSARDFIELARRKTAENRKEIIGNIADLFLDDHARLSDRERSLMTGILRSLIAEVETALRRELCGVLAERSDIPDELKSALARKSLEIARPILMRSRALRSPELVECVKMRGREHWLAMSLRPSLASDTGDAQPAGAGDDQAASTGDDVVEALLRHSDPELVQQASDYLVAESERIDRLKMPVIRSADLPSGLALQLHWWISAALRSYLVTEFSVNPTVIDNQIEAATLAVVQRHASTGLAISELARRLIEKLAESDPVSAELLVRLIEAGRVPAFIAGLSFMAKLPEPTARRVVLRVDGESLAVLCKASGVDSDRFLSLYILIAQAYVGTGRLPSDARNSILTFYNAISKGNARAALNFWRRDPDFISAIEQVGPAHEDPPASE